MKPIEIHVEGYKIVISKDDEQPNISKDKQDGNITIPNYPDYTIPTPTNPNPFVILTDTEITTTNTETKGKLLYMTGWLER